MTNNTQKVGRAKLAGSYRNTKGNLVFRYIVTGTAAQLEAFKTAQGEYYRETDDKKPLWFTSRNAGDSVDLMCSSKGKIFADMSEFDAAANLVQQYGGNFGQELAKSFVAKLTGIGSKPQAQPVAEEPAESVDPADLNQA